MASKSREGPHENSRSERPQAGAVIRHTAIPGLEDDPGKWRRLVPAWIISGVFHVVLLGLFLLYNINHSDAEQIIAETVVIETKVDDNKPPPNLDNEEIGLDPDVPTNYNVTRIEEISVPGPVNPTEAVGIQDAAEASPQTLPPPPGYGYGQGAGADSNDIGHAKMVGTSGGYGGPMGIGADFKGRSGSTREQMVKEGGGNTASEAAVARGLKWFSLHQAPDGHWSLDNFQQHGRCNCTGSGQGNDIAGTAFGLLPFLGAGNTHKPNPDKAINQYSKNVERGLRYLLTKQNKESGDFGGGMYAHGLASIAVCEAYGLTSDPQLKHSAQKALHFIVTAQGSGGGWGYTPRAGNNDTSVGGWQLMALKSGQMAGLDVPAKTLTGCGKWLDSNSSADGGGYGYNGPGDGATPMTAVGLLCRQYLGWGPRNPGLQAGIAKLHTVIPAQANTMYYTYYATQVMHHMGGKDWDKWNKVTRDYLVQKEDQGNDPQHPHHRGSWSPTGDAHGGAGGRIMVSSMSLLTLEVYYRHLPLYRREMGGNK